uniref:Uncharacterized protein n=1 Tax=Pristionchus pacificus TaxID=54126 RepID=A0A2A6D0A4_PRIPA|eukprot:PDM83912.1 hypothetical protein PRIPAC_30399 [Pristionchus pacificus]
MVRLEERERERERVMEPWHGWGSGTKGGWHEEWYPRGEIEMGGIPYRTHESTRGKKERTNKKTKFREGEERRRRREGVTPEGTRV